MVSLLLSSVSGTPLSMPSAVTSGMDTTCALGFNLPRQAMVTLKRVCI